MLERMRAAQIFTMLDLRKAYHLIQIKEGHEYDTAFQTCYGQFEYRVMPFGLTKTPATFQAYIDDCLPPHIDDFAICYLDDILIYSTSEKEQEYLVKRVLERLHQFGLNCKDKKCQFGASEIGFLGFIISSDGIFMESDRISTIEDWPTHKSIRDLQVLVGFTNFYRRFMRKYVKVTAPISELLKKSTSKREWTRNAELAFQKLKMAFAEAPIHQHFDPAKPIILQMDAGGFAIAGILNQYNGFGILRPVNFYSEECSPAEQNYDTYDQELLAIVETMGQWRHYLEGANHEILIQCDHKDLEYFQTSTVLSLTRARWAEILSSHNFVIQHLEGKKNPADGPPRRPDYEEVYERPTARLLATLVVTTVEPFSDLLPAIKAAQNPDPLATDMKNRIGGQDGSKDKDTDMQWKVSAGALTFEGSIYVPDALRN